MQHAGHVLTYLHPTLVYLVVALPVAAGVIWRIRTMRFVGHAMAIGAGVFATVGLGMVFFHFSDRHSPLDSYPGYRALEGYVTAHMGASPPAEEPRPRARVQRGRHGAAHAPARPAEPPQAARIVTCGLMVIAFGVAGALAGLLGPIIAGYTASMALNIYFHGGHIDDILVWRQVFDAFKVNHLALEITCLLAGSFISVTDSVVAVLRRSPAPLPVSSPRWSARP